MYCRSCGAPNHAQADGHRICSAGHIDYTNPAPAVGIAIVRDGAVLLCQRGRPPKQGQWDLVGGFVDAGETVPEAARREALEETGLHVENLRRLHQAPGEYEPGKPTLNFLYVAEATGEPTASDDVAQVRWFPLHALPPLAWPHEADALRRLAARS